MNIDNDGFVVFDKIDKSYDGEILVVKNLNLTNEFSKISIRKINKSNIYFLF